MKNINILLIILDVLILVIMTMCMAKGINIGTFHIPSFQDIANYSQELTSAISNAEQKAQTYTEKLSTIKSNVDKMTKAKKAYLDLLTISTDSEIQKALQTRTYNIEYIWEKIGNYAAEEGVAVKMEITDSSVPDGKHKNLNFSVAGTYAALTNFISDLENSSELEFTIDNFDMIRVQYGSDKETKEECVFIVKDISIVNEKTTSNNVNETTKLTEPQDANKSGNSNTTRNTDTNNNNNNNTTSNNTVNETEPNKNNGNTNEIEPGENEN